ncbi:MAG: hypothetical protein HY074_08895 [Deltaproteobacteria bacterium]|nr:hypothetical protein [Deltaproteobacteria bacterium]
MRAFWSKFLAWGILTCLPGPECRAAQVLDFPQTSSAELATWIDSASEIVLYVHGGNPDQLVNQQIHLPRGGRLVARDFGTAPRTGGGAPNRVRWFEGSPKSATSTKLIARLKSIPFHALPADPKPPYADSIVLGIELHSGDQVRRWFWPYDHPARVVAQLRDLLEKSLKLALSHPVGDIRAALKCHGLERQLFVTNHGTGAVKLTAPSGNPVQIASGGTLAIDLPQTKNLGRYAWHGALSATDDSENSVVVATPCTPAPKQGAAAEGEL